MNNSRNSPPIRPSFWKIFGFLWEFFTEKPISTPAGMEDWARKHFDAVRVQDRAAYLELVHPLSRSALEEGGPMDNLIEKEFKAGPLESWTMKVTLVQPREALLMEDLLVYPIRPTHLARATAKLHSKIKTEVWYLVQEGEAWYSVLPLPKPEYADRMKAQAFEKGFKKQEEDDRIRKLYYAADPGHLTKIRELLQKNRKFEAIKKAEAEFKLDVLDAKRFVEFVENPSS